MDLLWRKGTIFQVAIPLPDGVNSVAQMHPGRLTEAFSASHTPSEQRVYQKISEELPDDYHVFHDFIWDDPSLDDSKTSGQIDFVVVHPNYGFVTLEVKGGRCSYQPELRTWQSTDRNGDSSVITDPFDQAATASRVILKLLLKQPALSRTFIPHHHAVVFPDCILDKRDLRANVKGWQILDQESLFNLKGSIKQVFDKAFPGMELEQQAGRSILNHIKSLWGDKAVDGRVSVNLRIREISEKLIRLTDEQLHLLQICQEVPRCRIQGCAGSGKTTLALHKAKLLAESGQTVLLTCFNQPLGRYLQKVCVSHQNITVGPFLDLSLKWLDEAGHPIALDDSDEFWSEKLPAHFVAHVDQITPRFDAIVVDEAQDFKADQWVMIELLFRDPANASFYIFSDGDQNIYRGSDKYPLKEAPLKLWRNVRNTNQIFSVVQKVCGLSPDIMPSGVNGPSIRYVPYADAAEMHQQIDRVLMELVCDNFRSEDIVLLGTKSQRRTSLTYGSKIGQFRLVSERKESADLLTMTVHRFKGLESPVVILCELDEELTHNLKEILYVGMTRPMGMLYVLYETGSKKTMHDLGMPLQ